MEAESRAVIAAAIAEIRRTITDIDAGRAGRYLTVVQAAQYLGMTQCAVRHWIAKRAFPVHRTGAAIRMDRRDLDDWLAHRKRA